jgi:uncharacterized protein HemY
VDSCVRDRYNTITNPITGKIAERELAEQTCTYLLQDLKDKKSGGLGRFWDEQSTATKTEL